jgi:hypothetical protein
VAEFLNVPFESEYVLNMSMFLTSLFAQMEDVHRGFFAVDVLATLLAFGFRSLPRVATLHFLHYNDEANNFFF